jgi:hypothetical protein
LLKALVLAKADVRLCRINKKYKVLLVNIVESDYFGNVFRD